MKPLPAIALLSCLLVLPSCKKKAPPDISDNTPTVEKGGAKNTETGDAKKNADSNSLDSPPPASSFDVNSARQTLSWYVSFKPKDTGGNALVDTDKDQLDRHRKSVEGKSVNWVVTVVAVSKDATVHVEPVHWPIDDWKRWEDFPAEDIRDGNTLQILPWDRPEKESQL